MNTRPDGPPAACIPSPACPSPQTGCQVIVKLLNVREETNFEAHVLQPGIYVTEFPLAPHNHEPRLAVLGLDRLPPPNSPDALAAAALCSASLAAGRSELLDKAAVLMLGGLSPTEVYITCLKDPALSEDAKHALHTFDRRSLNSAVRYLKFGMAPRPQEDVDDCEAFKTAASQAAGADPLARFCYTASDFNVMERAFWASRFQSHLLKTRGRILIFDTTHETNR